MFYYGILLRNKPLGYVQYNLLRNRSKRSVSELKQAIIQRDILEIWESESPKRSFPPYMQLIGQDLKIWHEAGIHFRIFRRHGKADWQKIADFSTSHADGLRDWQQESDQVALMAVALQNILEGKRDPEDLQLMSSIINESLPEDQVSTTRLLSETFPFQSADEQRELAALLQDEELRRFFMEKVDSVDKHLGKKKAGHTEPSKTKRGIWASFRHLFRRSG